MGDFYRNDALINLGGLENLSSIDGDVFVWGNAALTSLSGLDNLAIIGGYLWVLDNNDLTSQSGLDSLDYITIDNLQISWCTAVLSST